MSVRAGQIVIDLDAGTSKVISQMDVANVKIREFGSTSTSSYRQVSAELRVLQGNVTNNIRAAEAFVSTIKGLQPLIQAAFPVIGVIALAGVITEAGKKVYELVKGLQEVHDKSAAAWNNLIRPIQASNDELDLTNAKLKEDIAKLEGKPENNLEVALRAARVEADKLGESLNKNLESVNKLLTEQNSGFFNTSFGAGLVGGISGGIPSMIQALVGNGQTTKIQKDLGGESGQGGLFAAQQNFENGAKDVHEYTALIEKYQAVLSDISQVLHGTAIDQRQRETLESVARSLQAQMASIPKVVESSDLNAKKSDLEVRQRVAEATARFNAAMKALDKQIADSNAEIDQKMLLASIKKDDQWNTKDSEGGNSYIGQFNEKTHLAGLALAKQLLASQELQREIDLQTKLASVAGDYQATHQAELDAEVGKMRFMNEGTEAQIQQFIKLDALKQRVASFDRLSGLNQNIGGLQRTSNAAFGGADAARQAELENRLAEAKTKGAGEDELSAIRLEDEMKYYGQIVNDAGKLATADSDRMETLNREIAILQTRHDLNAQDVQLTTALKNLEDERLKIASQQALAQGSAMAGVRAFFLEMQTQAEKASQIIYTTLNDAVNKTSDNLANMLTGKKPKGGFGQMFATEFKDLGHSALQSTIKSSLQRGLGGLGKHFGIDVPGAKADGSTEANALWVRMAMNNLPQSAGGNGGLTALLDKSGVASDGDGLTSGSGGSGSFLGSLLSFLPHFAGGGDIDSGDMALVGEHGPELFMSRSAGTIIPNERIGNSSSSSTVNNFIDARNADLGAYNRIARGMEMSHASAVHTSVQVQHERARRTPQRTK